MFQQHNLAHPGGGLGGGGSKVSRRRGGFQAMGGAGDGRI